MDGQNKLWSWVSLWLKFVASNFIKPLCSTENWLGQMVLSGMIDQGKTTMLGVLEVNRSKLNIFALQLTKRVQNQDHDDALTWGIHLSPNWARLSYLVIWRCCKRIHTNWINQNGTCFTSISTDQKLAKNLEENWLDGICPNWVEIGYMDKRRPRKIYSHNGAT